MTHRAGVHGALDDGIPEMPVENLVLVQHCGLRRLSGRAETGNGAVQARLLRSRRTGKKWATSLAVVPASAACGDRWSAVPASRLLGVSDEIVDEELVGYCPLAPAAHAMSWGCPRHCATFF